MAAEVLVSPYGWDLGKQIPAGDMYQVFALFVEIADAASRFAGQPGNVCSCFDATAAAGPEAAVLTGVCLSVG
jgi:hypothetical protein